MKLGALALVVFALAGCESDEERLDRLQVEEAMAYADVLIWEQRIDFEGGVEFVRGNGPTDLIDSLRAAEDRLLLAERELNLFMGGR